MTNLVQWDPFAEIRSTMDRLFEQGFSRPWRLLNVAEYQATFPADIWETDEAIEVVAALPGVRPDDVDIAVVGNVLNIKASAHEPEAAQTQRNYFRRELQYGSYARSFSLPVSVEPDKAEARYEHGMLYLTLPKAESVRPKQIKIAAVAGNGHRNN